VADSGPKFGNPFTSVVCLMRLQTREGTRRRCETTPPCAQEKWGVTSRVTGRNLLMRHRNPSVHLNSSIGDSCSAAGGPYCWWSSHGDAHLRFPYWVALTVKSGILRYCFLVGSSVIFGKKSFIQFRLICLPRAVSGVVRIEPLRFLAGCRKRRLNQTRSVLSLSLVFLVCLLCR